MKEITAPSTVADQLTTREADVMRLIARGMKRREIARRLEITRQTVDKHASNLAEKIPGPGRPAVKITRYYWLTTSLDQRDAA